MFVRTATSTFLIKISKHLALLVCLLILSRASGRYEASQILILGLTVASSLLHLAGRALQNRLISKAVLRGGLS